VKGTVGPDTVNAVADGTDVAVFGATPGVHVQLTGVPRLDVDLLGGADFFSATGNLAPLTTLDVDGGDASDTLLGGNGADVFTGGAGDDFLDGNQGADLVQGGEGADTFQWDPGDSNDTVEGGPGTDRLAFNGSNIGENLDVSAVAGRVRISRNIGLVTLDVDDVETVDIRTLGGADVVTVNDLSGTDVMAVNTDLAGSIGGGPDGSADQVVVNGTSDDDTIVALDVGATVEVQGLPAVVRIANAEPTLDTLTVNGLAGTDSITSTPGAGALILLTLNP
jgi:hypothetical protein